MMLPPHASHATLFKHLVSPLLSVFLIANAHATSLDNAVNAQLENLQGYGPCGRLLDAGGEPTNSLLTICGRAVPVGTTPSSSGGGSASPAAAPTINTKAGDLHTEMDAVSIAGPWSLFLTVENESLDRDASRTEGAFKSSLNRVTFGSTLSPSSRTALSLALNMSQHNGDFDGGGDFRYDAQGLHFIGSLHLTPELSVFVGGFYDKIKAERKRLSRFDDSINGASIFFIDGTPTTEYDYGQLGMTLQGVYEITTGPFSLSTQFGFDWVDSDYGNYSEHDDSGLALTFHDDNKTSLQAAWGFQATYTIGTRYGAVIPQVGATWRHEFHNDGRNINVSFVDDINATRFQFQTDPLDANFTEFHIGAVLVLKHGVQMFANVQKSFAHENYDRLIASAGVRIEL